MSYHQDAIQRALDSLSAACTETGQLSKSQLLASDSMDIMALHLMLVIIHRQLVRIAERPGVASRRPM
jgi:hypothetical protein